MAKNSGPMETNYPAPARPASAARLDGWRRLALGAVLQAVADAGSPSPWEAWDALSFLADPYGAAWWLAALNQPGANDPERLVRAALSRKTGGKIDRYSHP